MVFYIRKFQWLFFILFLVATAGSQLCSAAEHNKAVKITLEVVEAFDTRLPVLSKTDVRQILDEAKRMFSAKLGNGNVDIEFHDNGVISLEELFNETKYQTEDNQIYQFNEPWKYNLEIGDKMEFTEDFKTYVMMFLRQWDLDSVKRFFPDAKIDSYEDLYTNLFATYHSKIKWLKTLKTPGGENLVIMPPVKYQSEVEWKGLISAQEKYDVIITNTLIIEDAMLAPYPHSISRHAKIGGEALYSPKRGGLLGKSVLISVLEDYGDIEGIAPSYNKEIARELKNNIIGGFYLAHELGHAIFNMLDVYDHGESCIMNSFKANDDRREKYGALLRNNKTCPECAQWIEGQTYVIRAKQADNEGRFEEAGSLFMIAANQPSIKNKEKYSKYLTELACKAYTNAQNKEQIKISCDK